MSSPTQRPTERLKIQGTKPVRIKIISDPYIIDTVFGYAPVIDVAVGKASFYFFIGTKSLADGIEKLRAENGGAFIGLELKVRRASDDKKAPYVVE
jgi:hypothetical protein